MTGDLTTDDHLIDFVIFIDEVRCLAWSRDIT